MDTKTTALADGAAAPKLKPVLLHGVSLNRITVGGISSPVAFCKGKAAKVGELVEFVLEGQTFTGTVKDAVEADGSVMLEFVDGLTLVTEE